MCSDGYCTWSVRLCVCVCVCLSVYLYSPTTDNKAARERYACLQRNKRSKNNVANLVKTAAFWQEKPASSWTTFCDPTHQLAWCACIFITRLLDWLSPCGSTAWSPALLLQVPLACFRTVTRVCSYIPHGSCCHGYVSQLLAHTAPVYTNRVCAEGLHFSAFHSRSNCNKVGVMRVHCCNFHIQCRY